METSSLSQLRPKIDPEWMSPIESAMNRFRKSRKEAEAAAVSAMRFIAAAETQIGSARNQSLLSRVWGGITGETRSLEAKTASSLVAAQTACVDLIARMGEENLLLHDTVLALQSQLTYLFKEENGFRSTLGNILTAIQGRFEFVEGVVSQVAKQTRDHNQRIKRLEEELARHRSAFHHLEHFLVEALDRISVIEWSKLVEEAEYGALPPWKRLATMAKSFREAKADNWTPNDIRIFRGEVSRTPGFAKSNRKPIKEIIASLAKEVETVDGAAAIRSLLNLPNPPSFAIPETPTPLIQTALSLTISTFIESEYQFLDYTMKAHKIKVEKKRAFLASALSRAKRLGVELESTMSWADVAVEILFYMRSESDPPALGEDLENESSLVEAAPTLTVRLFRPGDIRIGDSKFGLSVADFSRLEKEIVKILNSKGKVPAIKHTRERTNLGLREARDLVDSIVENIQASRQGGTQIDTKKAPAAEPRARPCWRCGHQNRDAKQKDCANCLKPF